MATRRLSDQIKKILPLPVLLTLLLGILATGVLFKTVSRMESDKIDVDLRQRAAVRVAAIRQALARMDETLRNVNLLFEATDVVSRAEFAVFTRRLVGRFPYIQSISFQRILSSSQRAGYERAMRVDFRDFAIGHWEDGVRTTSLPRDSYRVIDFIEPAVTNEMAFGLDTSSKLVLQEAVDRACDTGQPSSTNLLTLPQGKWSADGIVMFMPVYRRGATPISIAARREALVGFTTVAFRAQDLIKQTLDGAAMLHANAFDLRVYMGEYPGSGTLIFSHPPKPVGHDGFLSRHTMYPVANERTESFEAAGKPWHVVIAPVPDRFFADHLASLLTLVAGLLATLLGTANLQMFVTRARRVKRLVHERTDELHHANALLTNELATRNVMEQTLLLRERAIECSPNAIIISSATGPEFPVLYVNAAFERTTGYRAEEIVGRSCRILHRADSKQAGLEEIRAALREQRPGHAIVRNYRKDGTMFWNDLHVSPVRDSNDTVTHFVAAQYDVTDMKRYQAELEFQASYDTLTGLTNRNLLHDRLKTAIAQATRNRTTVCVVLFDLDQFKLINDTLGYLAGDQVLQTVAGRFTAAAREIDTVARFSGDEFVLVLPQSNIDLCTEIVQRFMLLLSASLTQSERELHLTSSVGIAVFPADGTDAEALLTHAGIAMFRAKERGRNNFQFYRPEMNEKARDRLRIKEELHNALERDEFLLHYQPQVDLASGRVVGMEALLRWMHPTTGIVSPLNFIPVAEETGLIVPIGAWVLRRACAQNRQWQEAGLGNLRVAVNLSARQFAEPDLVAMIAAILKETGLAPQFLEIELTESLIMSDVEQVILTLQQLKQIGVQISVDDFGTGYSSLAYLKKFPIDTLKIDQAFVRDITSDADDAAIVDAIISLAHSLRFNVIAEGVETALQLQYLQGHGCDEIQGYFFSRPLPADAFEAFIRTGAALGRPQRAA